MRHGNDDTLTGSKAIVLDHYGQIMLPHIGQCKITFVCCEALVRGGGNAMPGHKVLGKAL